MRLHVDREQCCSAGMCALTAPDVFDQDEEDGRVVLLTAEPPHEAQPAAANAIELCPSGAISLIDWCLVTER